MAEKRKQQGTFPVVEAEEIKATFQELGITLTTENLKHPTPDLVISVFKELVEKLFGLTEDDLAPGMGVLELLEYEFCIIVYSLLIGTPRFTRKHCTS